MRDYGYWKWDHEGLKFEPIPIYGDLLTWESFVDCVDTGLFIDYDGYGHYSTEDKMSNKRIYPSDLKTGHILHGFTHVVWFNR
jgi:hypothetical protein